jgi:hypothetical protein
MRMVWGKDLEKGHTDTLPIEWEFARGCTFLFFEAVYLPFLAQSFYEPKVMMKKEIFINQSILRRGFFHFLPRDSIQAVQRVSSEAQNKTFKSRESIPVLPDLFDAPSSERDKFQMSCFLHKIPSLLRIFSLFPCPVSTATNRQNGSGALSENAFCLQLKQSMGQLNGHPF